MMVAIDTALPSNFVVISSRPILYEQLVANYNMHVCMHNMHTISLTCWFVPSSKLINYIAFNSFVFILHSSTITWRPQRKWSGFSPRVVQSSEISCSDQYIEIWSRKKSTRNSRLVSTCMCKCNCYYLMARPSRQSHAIKLTQGRVKPRLGKFSLSDPPTLSSDFAKTSTYWYDICDGSLPGIARCPAGPTRASVCSSSRVPMYLVKNCFIWYCY